MWKSRMQCDIRRYREYGVKKNVNIVKMSSKRDLGLPNRIL